MYQDRLPARAYVRQLRRQSLPELMDGDCLAALDHVEAQFGDRLCFMAGLEVRLGSPLRYADYTLCTTDDAIFPGAVVWLEMDYQAFNRPGEIVPCLFLNTWEAARTEDPTLYWDRALAAFAGESKADRLKRVFFSIAQELPRDICIKQIGAMARPGEADSLRVVIRFEDGWRRIPGTLKQIGWKADAKALQDALMPYEDIDWMAVNIDINSEGIRDKIGIEMCPRWRHPVLVDRMVARLERAGLCRADKGQALRRWVRIPPDDDPFIQAVISHYKLNYMDGKITEAKAYLGQSPRPLHRLYDRLANTDL